jgi:hypothetical protein
VGHAWTEVVVVGGPGEGVMQEDAVQVKEDEWAGSILWKRALGGSEWQKGALGLRLHIEGRGGAALREITCHWALRRLEAHMIFHPV